MDRIKAATVFVETVTRGSISAAASHLGISRAMATRYVALMEEWAGASFDSQYRCGRNAGQRTVAGGGESVGTRPQTQQPGG